MTEKLNIWHQTAEWEGECVKTRRGIKLRQRRLNFLHFKKKDYILDLGCGDGLNISILRKKGVKKIVGLDISKELLKEAKKNNPWNKFYLATAEKIPFKNGTFDAVLVDSVFHHFMRYGKGLREIYRILKPGGKLCFIEPHNSIFRKAYDLFSISPFAKYVPFFKERGPAYKSEIKFMKHWLSTENEFYGELRKVGFEKKLHESDILSIVGIYEKPKN